MSESKLATSTHTSILPVIGLTTRYLDTTDECAALGVYIRAVEAAGAIPMLLPASANDEISAAYLDHIDGLLITGGDDCDPALYHEERRPETQMPPKLLDQYETVLIHEALKRDLPLFGVCRGIQILNVVCGGTLYQDIKAQVPHTHNHVMRPPYCDEAHKVQILEGTPLYELMHDELAKTRAQLGVNSRHHQAIKDLAKGFEVMALSDDGLIEAMYLPEKRFVWGVQWHPELMCFKHPAHMQLIQHFVDACKH